MAAVAYREDVVPASELAVANKQICELQSLLDKKWIAHVPLLLGDKTHRRLSKYWSVACAIEPGFTGHLIGRIADDSLVLTISPCCPR